MSRVLIPAVAFVAGLLAGGAGPMLAGSEAALHEGPSAMITGIGGVFFKSEDPEELRAWYREHLGFDTDAQGVDFAWREKDDPTRLARTVWNVFPADTEHFGPTGQGFMVNYRVSDLEALISRLEEKGIHPVRGPEDYAYGRFAWILDGDGNRLELWEPADTTEEER